MSETPLEARRAWIFQFPVPDPMPNCWMSFRKPEGAMPSSILSSSFKLWTCPSNISLPSNFRLIGPVSSAPDDSLSLSRIMLLGPNKLLTADLAMCWMDMCPGAICTNLKCLSGIMTLLDKVVCIDRGHARKKCKIYIYSQLPSWWATKKQCSCWSKCCDNIFPSSKAMHNQRAQHHTHVWVYCIGDWQVLTVYLYSHTVRRWEASWCRCGAQMDKSIIN